jgi:hypothetical protein
VQFGFGRNRANMTDASRTPERAQDASVGVFSTVQEPRQGAVPATPLAAVVTQMSFDTDSGAGANLYDELAPQAGSHDFGGSIQPYIAETHAFQVQRREVPPASWDAAKLELGMTTTTQLKAFLKLISVVGASNAPNKLKIDAVAARMRQHNIPLCCLEDAEDAHDILAAIKDNNDGNDAAVESPTQTQLGALARFNTLTKAYVRVEKSPTPGDGDACLV